MPAASRNGSPRCVISIHAVKPESRYSPPWAKFATPERPKVRLKPSAVRSSVAALTRP
jgi:hypothetical protein